MSAAHPYAPPPSDSALNARILARVAELDEGARLALARGVVSERRGIGPVQQRALRALRAEALTPSQLRQRLGLHGYAEAVRSIAGLAARGLIALGGEAWACNGPGGGPAP